MGVDNRLRPYWPVRSILFPFIFNIFPAEVRAWLVVRQVVQANTEVEGEGFERLA